MNKIASHLDFHAQALMLRSRRNEILASNIANAATPNYKARDVDFETELARSLDSGPIASTNSRHIGVASKNLPGKIQYRQSLNPSLDGNTVELAVEQMEFAENSTRYQTTLNFINSKLSGLYSAIRGE